MSSFRQTINARRLNAGTLVRGRWVPNGTPTTFTITASVQPLKPNEVESLPEGRRNSKVFRIYTCADLQDMQVTESPDQVQLFGEWYEVTAKAPWQNSVINHFKYIVTKLLES